VASSATRTLPGGGVNDAVVNDVSVVEDWTAGDDPSTVSVPPDASTSQATTPVSPGNVVEDPTVVAPGVPVPADVLNAPPCAPPPLIDAWEMIVHPADATNVVEAVWLFSAPKRTTGLRRRDRR
jgi:hypothetical protein